MRIRAAHTGDLKAIMAVLEAAKGIMRADGNAGQWVNGYPSEEVILKDIESNYGFIAEEIDGRTVAYFAFIPSPEPTYNYIEGGSWLNEAPYHVVHRIGSYPEVHGVFRAIMAWCFSKEPNIRIDTHKDNHIMQHCIVRYGFTYCGIIYLASGDQRLAYQKTARWK